MLCLIGETFDTESLLVNGAVVNVRNKVCWHHCIIANFRQVIYPNRTLSMLDTVA